MKLIHNLILPMLLCCVGGGLSAQGDVDFTKITNRKITSNPDVKWTQFGPGGAGNNYYIHWHTTDPNTVYHGPNMGNSYRSTDRGVTYEGIMDADGSSAPMDRGPIEIVPVEFSYQNPDFGFCSCESRGFLFTSSDRGATWTKCDAASAMIEKNDNRINSICVDPKDDNIWYLGTGKVKDANHFFYTEMQPHGSVFTQKQRGKRDAADVYVSEAKDLSKNGLATIWKSTNRGKSWSVITPKGISQDAQITEIYVHPANSNKLFAATTYGFYVSENQGKSWTLKDKSGLDNNIIRSIDMHYDAASKKITFVAIDLVKYIPVGKSMTYNGGIYKSVDEGESWQCINGNLPHSKEFMSSRAIRGNYYKLALSNWFDCKTSEVQARYPEMPESMMQSFSEVKINPSDPNKMLLVNNYKSQYTFPGGMLWRTDDGGKSWIATLRNGTRWDKEDKEYWEARNNPITKNVTLRGQSEWVCRDAYDRKAGATITYNTTGDLIMFQYAKVVCVSEDGGDTWYENDEIDASDDGSEHWVGAGNSNLPGREIYQDIRLKDYLYFCAGENSIYRTSKFGEEKYGIDRQSVKKINIPSRAKHLECSVSSMIVDPDDVNTLYSVHFRQGFYGKLMKTTDGGENWAEQGTIFDVPKKYHVSTSVGQICLTIDPDYHNRFYVIVKPKDKIKDRVKFISEYGVYGSMDGGVTFNVMSDGITSQSVSTLKASPNEKGVLYCGALGMNKGEVGGLFRLDDGATTWKRVKLPAGMSDIYDIEFSIDGKMYIAGGSIDGSAKSGGVWCTSDMKRWSQLFPYKIANFISVAKYDPSVLLVGVRGDKGGMIVNPGVFRSSDSGESWEKINRGNIQSDRLVDLQLDYHRKGIYWCTTYGAGFYKGVDHKMYK